MAAPTIPKLTLANDDSAMGTHTQDTYGLQFKINAAAAWTYTPAGRFPEYTAQIVITIKVGAGDADLCPSQSQADTITFTTPQNVSMSPASYDSTTQTVSWAATITEDANHVILDPKTPLIIQMGEIEPNDAVGKTSIVLTPKMIAKPGSGNSDVSGTDMVYTVEKTQPPMIIDNVDWSLQTKPGAGKLTWKATGAIEHCTLGVDGEPIGKSSYTSTSTQYSADITLESSTQSVTITAVDANHNTATLRHGFHFSNYDPYFSLKTSNGRPISVIESDQTAFLNAVFEDDTPGKTGGRVWRNGHSGTQDNWTDTGIVLPSGMTSSPVVYYSGSYYLMGGSRFDLGDFSADFLIYADNRWQTLAAPAGWTEPRMGQAVALFDQQIWVAGGFGASGTVYSDVYSFKTDNNGGGTWTKQAALPSGLCCASMVVVNGSLYLFGGYSDAPNGTATNSLYLRSSSGWTNQQKAPPTGAPDYWTLGSVKDALYLLGSFGGTAFTGTMTNAPHWQGGDANLSNVVIQPPSQPPYGMNTVQFGAQLFFAMADTSGKSVLAFYAPPDPAHADAQKEDTDAA